MQSKEDSAGFNRGEHDAEMLMLYGTPSELLSENGEWLECFEHAPADWKLGYLRGVASIIIGEGC